MHKFNLLTSIDDKIKPYYMRVKNSKGYGNTLGTCYKSMNKS